MLEVLWWFVILRAIFHEKELDIEYMLCDFLRAGRATLGAIDFDLKDALFAKSVQDSGLLAATEEVGSARA